MPEYVSIAYRGATHALGQGPQFYGIWHAAALEGQPLERWPLTPEGWTAAWSRFTSLEVPGTITPVEPSAAGPVTGPVGPMTGPVGPVASAGGPMAGAAGPALSEPDPAVLTRKARLSAVLIGVGLVLGIAGLFPAYLGGASLASQSVNLVPHAIYIATWTLSAALILAGGIWLRVGALLGLGTSAVTLGLFVADVGTVGTGASGGGQVAGGAGLALSILGWLACTAGVALAAASWHAIRSAFGSQRRLARGFRAQPGQDIVPLAVLVLAAVGAAVAFAPSWDRFTVRTSVGLSQTFTEGNAFANPAPMMLGDILVMIAIVAVRGGAALGRPLRLGAALAIGAAVPMVAQAISAIVQISQPVSAQQLGIPASEVARLGITSIDSGLTAIFWVYCAFLGTLLLVCAWMLVAHGPAASSALPSGGMSSAPGGRASGGRGPAGGGPAAGWDPDPAEGGSDAGWDPWSTGARAVADAGAGAVNPLNPES